MHIFTLYTSTSRNKPSSLAFGTNKAKKKWIISSMAQSFATCQARKRAGEPGLLLWILGEEGPGHWNCYVQMKIMKQWFKHLWNVIFWELSVRAGTKPQPVALPVPEWKDNYLNPDLAAQLMAWGLWTYRRFMLLSFKDVGRKMKKFNLHFQHFSSFRSAFFSQ